MQIEINSAVEVTKNISVKVVSFDTEKKEMSIVLGDVINTTAKVISGTDDEFKAVVGKTLTITPAGVIEVPMANASPGSTVKRGGSSQYVERPIR